MRNKPRLLLVGAGDVAQRAMPWLAARFRVYAVVRRAEAVATWRAAGAVPVLADLDQPSPRLAPLGQRVLHLAPPPSEGRTDPRTKRLIAMLSRPRRVSHAVTNEPGSLPQSMVYISTSGVYGDRGGAWLDETATPRARNERALRRLDAEGQLRRWARYRHVRLGVLRVPGIYAADRLPLARLKAGTPALRAEEDSYTNHIHADDLARVASLALFRVRPNRVYHAVDDAPEKMGDYFDRVADAYGLPRPPRIGREEAGRVLSPALMSFFNESRRLTNRRLKRELRVRLKYPTSGWIGV